VTGYSSSTLELLDAAMDRPSVAAMAAHIQTIHIRRSVLSSRVSRPEAAGSTRQQLLADAPLLLAASRRSGNGAGGLGGMGALAVPQLPQSALAGTSQRARQASSRGVQPVQPSPRENCAQPNGNRGETHLADCSAVQWSPLPVKGSAAAECGAAQRLQAELAKYGVPLHDEVDQSSDANGHNVDVGHPSLGGGAAVSPDQSPEVLRMPRTKAVIHHSVAALAAMRARDEEADRLDDWLAQHACTVAPRLGRAERRDLKLLFHAIDADGSGEVRAGCSRCERGVNASFVRCRRLTQTCRPPYSPAPLPADYNRGAGDAAVELWHCA
jgi:hypothetical protein